MVRSFSNREKSSFCGKKICCTPIYSQYTSSLPNCGIVQGMPVLLLLKCMRVPILFVVGVSLGLHLVTRNMDSSSIMIAIASSNTKQQKTNNRLLLYDTWTSSEKVVDNQTRYTTTVCSNTVIYALQSTCMCFNRFMDRYNLQKSLAFSSLKKAFKKPTSNRQTQNSTCVV